MQFASWRSISSGSRGQRAQPSLGWRAVTTGKKRIKVSIRAQNVGKNLSSFTAAWSTAGIARADSPHSLLILQMWSRNKQQSGLYYIIKWGGLSLINIFQGLQGRMEGLHCGSDRVAVKEERTFFRPVWEGRTNTPYLSNLTKLPKANVRPNGPCPGPRCQGRVWMGARSCWFESTVLTEVLHTGKELPFTCTISPTVGPTLSSSL